MAKLFSDADVFGAQPPSGGLLSDDDVFGQPNNSPSGLARRALADPAISLAKGIVGVPEALVGLADIPTGGLAGKGAQAIGFNPKGWKESLGEYYSPEQKAANAAVEQAQGFGGTLSAAIQNPSVIANTVAESIPLMLGGGAIARALPAGLSAVARGALGEGIVGAGSAAEQIRQQSEDGLLSPKQSIASIASGAGTAAFGAAGGKIAQRLGIADVDTLLAGGAPKVIRDAAGKEIRKSLPRQIAEGAVSEGAFEELPQSMWEQAAQNFATGQPIGQGVPEAAALGALAGGVMGGVGGGLSNVARPPAGPLTKAVVEGEKSGIVQQKQEEQVIAEAAAQAEEDQSYLKEFKDSQKGQTNETTQNEQTTVQGSPAGLAGAVGGTGSASDVQPAAAVSPAAVQMAGDQRWDSGGIEARSPIEIGQADQQQIVQPAATMQAVGAFPDIPTGAITTDGTQAQEAKQAEARQPAQPGTDADAGVAPNISQVAPHITGVAPNISLAAPPQPPTNAGPLEQKSAAMPQSVKDSLTTDKQPASSLQAPSIDLSTRDDKQLAYLSTNGQPGYKEAAIAEIARRAGGNVSTPTPATSSLQGPTPRAYTKEKAENLAKGLTNRQRLPSEAYPHPTEPGKYAIRTKSGEASSASAASAAPDVANNGRESGAQETPLWKRTVSDAVGPQIKQPPEPRKLPRLEKIAKERPDSLTDRDRMALEEMKREKSARAKYLKDHKAFVERSNAHYRAVQDAKARGEKIPDAVKADYPHLFADDRNQDTDTVKQSVKDNVTQSVTDTVTDTVKQPKDEETPATSPNPTLAERKAAALERGKAKESAAKAAEARTVADRAPEVASLADRLKAAAAKAVGSRKAAIEARLARLEAAKQSASDAAKPAPAPQSATDDQNTIKKADAETAVDRSKAAPVQDQNFYYTNGDMGMKSDGSFTAEKRHWMTFSLIDALRLDANNTKPYGATRKGVFIGTVSGESVKQPQKPTNEASNPATDGGKPIVVSEKDVDSAVKMGRFESPVILYHGSASGKFGSFKKGIVFLTASKDDAWMFAEHPVLNKRSKNPPMVYSVSVPAGKIRDISEIVDEELDTAPMIDDVIATSAYDSLAYGEPYVAFKHPGQGDEYFTAIVSSVPESLSIINVEKRGEQESVAPDNATSSESSKPTAEGGNAVGIYGYSSQPESFQWAAKEVGGAVVYSRGDIALVEGFSPLGNAVYAGVKGDSRTRADISAYTGKMFSETEKAELEKAKADHVKEQGRLHEKAPDGPFSNGARFAKADGVSDELAGVAQKWLSMLGIKSRVFLATKADVSNVAAIDKYSLRGPFSAIRSAGTQNEADGGKRTLPNGDHYIILPKSSRKSQALEALAHEIGHALETDEWKGADRATKDAVIADYQKWLDTAGNTKAADWVKQLRAHTSGKLTHVATSETADRLPPYWRSFSEYFADQVSRWATTSDKPLTAVDTFFRRIALAMRRLYAIAAGRPYLPGPAMQAYLDARGESYPLPISGKPTAEAAPAKANAQESKGGADDTRFNVAGQAAITPSDSAIYDMAAEGKSAQEILDFIGDSSRRPFERYLARALKNLGVSSSIKLDSQGGWMFNRGGKKYAAAYNPRTDTVALFTPREATRHALHELTHAATLKAIAKGGRSALEMKRLFEHLKAEGSINGMYGMANIEEFVAEAFSNPKFQQALKAVAAPKGSRLQSAWDWFVGMVSRIMGIKSHAQVTALDRAMVLGAELMRENAALNSNVNSDANRYAIAHHGTPHVFAPEPGFPHGRFRLDKIGTGEGAQVYGWGVYLAESKDVAGIYANQLRNPVELDGKKPDMMRMGFAESSLVSFFQNRLAAKIGEASARQQTSAWAKQQKQISSDMTDAAIDSFVSRLGEGKSHIFKLDIPDDVMPKLLDWDKPLSEQHPAIRNKLSAVINEHHGSKTYKADVFKDAPSKNGGVEYKATGGDIYKEIASGGQKSASELLASIGIPGLRYLDGQSRTDGAGSHNYVIWDQKTLDRIALLERNGEALDDIRFNQADDGNVSGNVSGNISDTITIDGVERPRMNSNGKPIAQTDEALRKFWRWFSGSKVVDEQGRPLVVYHGASADFGENYAPVLFDFDRTADEDLSSGKGAYLTTSQDAASKYSYGISWGNGGQASAPNVMSVYARIEAPFSKTAMYRIEDFESVLPDRIIEDTKESAKPGESFLEDTQQAIDDLQSRLDALQAGYLNDEVANDYRIDESDYDSEDEYQAEIEEAIEREVSEAERSIERYEGEIERAWTSAKAEYSNARLSGEEIWDAIKEDLPEYADWKNERQLFGGDSASIEMDTKVARILFDAFGFDGVKRTDKFPIKSQHTVYIANNAPAQIKSATSNQEFSPDNPDIRYNVAADFIRTSPQVQQIVANAFASDSSTSWITPFNTQFHKAQKWAAEGKPWFKKVFDLGQQFLSDVSRFAVMAQSQAPNLFHEIKGARGVVDAIKGIRSIDDITGKTRTMDAEAIASPLYEGTLHGGGSPMKGRVFSDAELRAKYKLSDKQIGLYREALAAVNVSLDEMAKSIIAKHAKNEGLGFDNALSVNTMAEEIIKSLEQKKSDVGQKALEQTQDLLKKMDEAGSQQKMQTIVDAAEKASERIASTIKDVRGIVATNSSLQKHGYFPLMRFGKNTVTATDEDGKVQFFGMYEGVPLVPKSGQYQANRIAAEIRAENPTWTVETGIHDTEKYKLYQGLNLEAVQLFAAHMDQESKEPFQEFLRVATNDRSVQNRLIHRKGTPGFDRDVRRTLAQFITSNARHTSSNYHLFDMGKAASEVPQKHGDISGEAVRLHKYISEPMEEAQKLRGFMFFNYLGGSIASAAVNMTQIPAMTFPFLSKYESVGALGKRLALAAKLSMSDPKDVTGKVGEALRRAEMDGVTAPQEIHQLMATASNNIFAGSQGVNLFMKGWGKMFAMAETFNRRTTFIAAYQIADRMTPKQLAETGAKDAFEFAENAVKETQGIYNKGNRQNVGRGAVGATLMTFKQYSIMYLELLKRLPPKQRMIMMGVLMLSAGAGGLPFEDDIDDIIDTFGQWLGFATNTNRTIRKAATSVLGERGADIALNGLLSQLGIDVHSRLGMQNLLPGTGILKQSSVNKGRDIEEFFGPAGSLIASVGKSLENLATGRPGKAALDLAPVAVQNAFKGAKMAATGYAEDAKGRRTVPVDVEEAIAKGVGFNPKSVAEFGQLKRGISQDARLLQVKRESFSSAMVDAILSGDAEVRQEVMAEIRKWNENNPSMRVVINPGAIANRVRSAKMEGVDRFLKTTPRAMRGEAATELR